MLRYYGAAPSSHESGATLLLRMSWHAAAESWWSHHSSNDNDVMAQMAGAEGGWEAVLLASAEPVGRLLAADQQVSIIVSGQQSRRGTWETVDAV